MKKVSKSQIAPTPGRATLTNLHGVCLDWREIYHTIPVFIEDICDPISDRLRRAMEK